MLIFFFPFIDFAIYFGNLLNKLMSGKVIQFHYLIQIPVKMIGDIRYLPDQVLPGVADYFPRLPISTSN